MKKNIDLLTVLKTNKMRITPMRRVLIQYLLDHRNKQISLKELQDYINLKLPGIDRSSVYRNIEALKKLDIIQELNTTGSGKLFQFVWDKKIHQFYICKSCGKIIKTDKDFFKKIDAALNSVPGFQQTRLSAVFYGYCVKCK